MDKTEERGIRIGYRERARARVLGCLAPGSIAVLLLDEQGEPYPGLPLQLPVETIPPDLRMPNSEFDLLFDPSPGVRAYTSVVRTGEAEPCLPVA